MFLLFDQAYDGIHENHILVLLREHLQDPLLEVCESPPGQSYQLFLLQFFKNMKSQKSFKKNTMKNLEELQLRSYLTT
jgi:hypothetical protein